MTWASATFNCDGPQAGAVAAELDVVNGADGGVADETGLEATGTPLAEALFGELLLPPPTGTAAQPVASAPTMTSAQQEPQNETFM